MTDPLRSRSPDAVVVRREIVRRLRRFARPGEAKSARSYLGSPLPVLAVRTPELRDVLRTVAERARSWSPRELRIVANALWHGRFFEERILAIELVDRWAPYDDPDTWRLLNRWVDDAIGWALSDSLAAGPIAARVGRDARHFRELLSWSRSPNLWRRRAAAYALHDWVSMGELDRPLRVLACLVRDSESWVQRAVGTWLRECWKRDPGRTERFLARHARVLAPVTITVATERAPASVRARLRRARFVRPRTVVRRG